MLTHQSDTTFWIATFESFSTAGSRAGSSPSAMSIWPFFSAWTIASWLVKSWNTIVWYAGFGPQKFGLRSKVQLWPSTAVVMTNGPDATLGSTFAAVISLRSLSAYFAQTCSGAT